MTAPAGAGWYPDPYGRYEHRFWDGLQWTHHVGSRGQRASDPPGPPLGVNRSGAHAPAGWRPDPSRRHEFRYWDGRQWTRHVQSSGRTYLDQSDAGWGSTDANVVAQNEGGAVRSRGDNERRRKKVERQALKGGAVGDRGGGTLFTEQVLVVNQRAKLFGSNLRYDVFDKQGRPLGAIQEVARDVGTRVVDHMRGRDESTRTRRFQVVDNEGRVALTMTRPESRFGLKPRMIVTGPDGREIGVIARETLGVRGAATEAAVAGVALAAFTRLGLMAGALVSSAANGTKGHTRFGLESGGKRLGSIHAEAINAWSFSIRDAEQKEIGRVTKTWAGYAKERFTKADHYVLVIHRPLTDPLHSLVIGAALALDVALKEGEPSSVNGSLLNLNKRRYQ